MKYNKSLSHCQWCAEGSPFNSHYPKSEVGMFTVSHPNAKYLRWHCLFEVVSKDSMTTITKLLASAFQSLNRAP